MLMRWNCETLERDLLSMEDIVDTQGYNGGAVSSVSSVSSVQQAPVLRGFEDLTLVTVVPRLYSGVNSLSYRAHHRGIFLVLVMMDDPASVWLPWLSTLLGSVPSSHSTAHLTSSECSRRIHLFQLHHSADVSDFHRLVTTFLHESTVLQNGLADISWGEREREGRHYDWWKMSVSLIVWRTETIADEQHCGPAILPQPQGPLQGEKWTPRGLPGGGKQTHQDPSRVWEGCIICSSLYLIHTYCSRPVIRSHNPYPGLQCTILNPHPIQSFYSSTTTMAGTPENTQQLFRHLTSYTSNFHYFP